MDLTVYRRVVAALHRHIKHPQRLQLLQFCESLNATTIRNPISSIHIANCRPSFELAEALVSKFLEQISTTGYCLDHLLTTADDVLPAFPMDELLTELSFALRSCNRRSAPGADGITYQALQNIDPLMHFKLLKIYN